MEKKYCVSGCELNEKNLTLQETIFHNANGYLGVRGTLEEGCPEEFDTMRGMYINGFYDMTPMKQAEKLCGLVEDKESMVNAADTQTILVTFGERQFSMFDGTVADYERELDMERGVTSRRLRWLMPEGSSVEFDIRRMASFEERSLFTIDYTFRSLDFEGDVEIRSFQKGLVKNYCNPDDPRLADESPVHLVPDGKLLDETGSRLAVRTAESGLTAVTAVAHRIFINGAAFTDTARVCTPEAHEVCVSARFRIRPGDEVRLVKYTVMCDSVRCGDCMNETINERLRGVSRMESLEIILERYAGEPLADEQKQALAAEKNDCYVKLLETMDRRDVSEEVADTLKNLRRKGWLLAVGSSSRNAGTILRQTRITDLFDAVADGTDITRSKPDPEVFLKAAEFLGLPPDQCIVVEDARSGIDAAKAAGMTAVGIGSAAGYERCDRTIHTFRELETIF